MSALPFHCLHPRRVKVNDDYINVPCGKCEACTVSSSLRRKSLIDVESLDYKYCMFVTLTYDEKSVPRMRLVRDDEMYISHFEDCTRREKYHLPVGEDGYIFHLSYNEFFPSPSNLRKMSAKTHCPDGEFMYLNYSDCQKFIKRLRRRIDYYLTENEKSENQIKYFYVGEYTPLHFRPHFHLLFFFNSDAVFINFSNLVSASWKFGISCSELSKGGCSSYVSSYINGYASVPKVLTQSAIRQKAVHSAFFGESLFKEKYEKLGQVDNSMFARTSCSQLSSTSEFSAPRSLERRFYPKCQRFVHLDKGQLFLSYCSYYSTVAQYRTVKALPTSVKEYAELLCEDFNSPVTRMLCSLYGCDLYYKPEKVERILRTSMCFLSNCEKYDITVVDYIDAIISYYKKKELVKLSNFYLEQEEFIRDWCVQKTSRYAYLNLFYDISYHSPHPCVENLDCRSLFQSSFVQDFDAMPTVVKWRRSPMFGMYKNSMVKCLDGMIKHKKINDLNQIFIKTIE